MYSKRDEVRRYGVMFDAWLLSFAISYLLALNVSPNASAISPAVYLPCISIHTSDAHFIFSEGRKLLQASELEQLVNDSYNCTPPAIKEFPSDGLTRQQRQAGFIIVHFVIAIYLFLLLAIVCDDYFVPSIKKICESEYCWNTERIVQKMHRFLV